MSSLSERRAGLYLHWGDSGGGTLGRSYSKTEAGAIKNGVKNPVYVPEGTTFKIDGIEWVHLDNARPGRPVTIFNGLPLARALNLPDPDK